ncbi:vWA domain-containing protein [Fimbriiglobus ruber]|nr:VWA domain-containing protein [Fimbriiglobus ruber]
MSLTWRIGIPLPRAWTAAIALGVGIVAGCGGESKSPPNVTTTKAYNRDIGLESELPAAVDPSKPRVNYDKLQQEQYEHFVDNEFQAVAQHPLSTFSADVNTASYSNVRRFLDQGKLPPKDAVHLAEFINYFPYSYPPPSGDDPVSFTLDLAPCPWQPKHHLARIGVRAKEIPAAAMPPRNLVFLVDVSGSMAQDTRLPLVKKSLNLLIDQLTPRDYVSVVVYASDCGVRLGPTPGSMKQRIREVVNALEAGGSTNGGSGINLAYQQARANFIEGGANRVILCTDGDFNVGVTSEGELVELIERQRKGNVFLTVLGYGMGNVKNTTMEKLANHGNGHYAYIDSVSEAHKVFVEQGAALVTVAKDVKLQVEFNRQRVSAYRLIGYENRMLKHEDFKNDAKDAGDIGSGHTVTALYEIQ